MTGHATRGRIAEPCSYAEHRAHDWLDRNVGLAVCGICHPPSIAPERVLWRGDDGFAALERRHRKRPRARRPVS